MARFLFVVIPEKGHINPYIGPARSLQHRGHAVAFYAAHDVSDYLKACGFETFFLGDSSHRPPSDANRGRVFAEHVRDPKWLRNWIKSVLLDPVPAQVEILRGVIREWRPDVVAIDSMVYAGAIAATREGVPWASLSSSLNPVASRAIETELTRTIAWLSPDRERLFAEHDMHPEFRVCDVLSPFLTTVFATKEFVEPGDPPPVTLYLVGPSIPPRRLDNGPRRPAIDGFPQERFDEAVRRKQPIICASLGSQIYYQPRIWRTAFDAVRGEPVFLVASVGELLGTEELGEVPENVLAAREIPQLEILDHASLLISHGGANSVMEALAAGVPVLVSPLCNDQPVQAHYLEKAGVGRRLDLNTAAVEECREAVRELLRAHEDSLWCTVNRAGASRTSARGVSNGDHGTCHGVQAPCYRHEQCPHNEVYCEVHQISALRESYARASGSDTTARLLLEYVSAVGLPSAPAQPRLRPLMTWELRPDFGWHTATYERRFGTSKLKSSLASRIRLVRVRCRELQPLEIWDMELEDGLLWEHPERMFEALGRLRSGNARFRWSSTSPAAAADFDGCFIESTVPWVVWLRPFLLKGRGYRLSAHTRGRRRASHWGGARLLHRLGLMTGEILDVGQHALKHETWRISWTPAGPRIIPRDPRLLPFLKPGEIGTDIEEARRKLVSFVAASLAQNLENEGVGQSFIFGLPCELDDNGVPGPCSYAGLEGYRDFVRDVLEAAGVKIATAYVMNDAELAALASPGRLGKRVLTVTMGYGIGACLRVGDFGHDSDWVQHARIDLRPIGE